MSLATEGLRARTRALLPSLVEDRRALHRVPELGLDLPETAALLAAGLRRLGLEPKRSGSGLWADLGTRGPLIALRADTDALPLDEVAGRSYGSTFPGRMHACGHDAHAASLLSAAAVLAAEKDLPYRVRLLFQPGEEAAFGARVMIEAGALEGVVAIAGGHVGDLSEELGPGQAGFLPGPMMAAADRFSGAFVGTGCHGAAPHQAADPILGFAEYMAALQALRSREILQTQPAVVSICSVHSGSSSNVIPERLEFMGTARSLDRTLRAFLERRIGEIGRGVAAIRGLSFEFEWEDGYSPVINDPRSAELAEDAARKVLGTERVKRLTSPIMGGEDFAFYLERVPGCFWFFNTQNPGKGMVHPNHSPRFDVDEELLPDFVAVNLAIVAALAAEAGAHSPGN